VLGGAQRTSLDDAHDVADIGTRVAAGKIEEAKLEAYADGRQDALEDLYANEDYIVDAKHDELAVDQFEEFVASAMAADTSDSYQQGAIAEKRG